MNSVFRYLSFLILIFSAASCTTDPDKVLARKWNITNQDMTDLKYSGYISSIAIQAVEGDYFKFYPDHKYTYMHLRNFDYGHWVYNPTDSRIKLISEKDPDTLSLIVKKIGEEQLILEMQKHVILKSNMTITFKPDETTHSDSIDLYGKSLNLWRVKPTKPESDGQLRDRVKNNISYCSFYLKDALDTEKKIIDLGGLVSPFRIGSNGIGLESFENVSDKWIQIFYNKAQAQQAYNMIVEAMSNNIDIPETSGWVELDSYLLRKVQEKI